MRNSRHREPAEAGPRPAEDPRPEEYRQRRQKEHASEQKIEDQRIIAPVTPILLITNKVRRTPDAPEREAADDVPVHRLLRPVDRRSDALGHRRVEQVGADRSRRMEAEQHNQHRSHQRSPAHARHSDERADEETSQRIERIIARKNGLAPVLSARFAHCASVRQGPRRARLLDPAGICRAPHLNCACQR